MFKLTSAALAAAVGIAGLAVSLPAAADPYGRLGVECPGVAVVAPLRYAPAYYGPRFEPRWYWHHDRDRYWRDHERRHWEFR